MSNLTMSCILGFVLLVGSTTQPRADPIQEVIDIRSVLARHDIGNAHGLAFNPESNMIYLAHGSDPRGGFIYTLGVHGNFISELDFQTAYHANSYPQSLSYEKTSGHLLVDAIVAVGAGFENHLVEIDPNTENIYSDLLINGPDPVYVRGDGIWQTRFSEDVIRHYNLAGAFVEDVSVASSFPGFPGPSALTSSLDAGFYVVDHFGRRIVQIDIAGNEVGAASTTILGNGRGLAIASDVDTERIFLQVNNEEIYVLSSQFVKALPEPDTWAMLLMGLGLVGVAVKQRHG